MLGDKIKPRTVISMGVHGHAYTHEAQGKHWKKINSAVDFVSQTDRYLVSQGSSSGRENILMDLGSKQLAALVEQAKKNCQGRTVPEILAIVNEMVGGLATGRDSTHVQAVESFVNGVQGSQLKVGLINPSSPPDILLDAFMGKRLLVCRHRSIIAAHILSSLVKEKILPPGNVRQYRSTLMDKHIQRGAHTWAVYRDHTTGDLWMCDPMWDRSDNLTKTRKTMEGEGYFGYGKKTLDEMVRRLDAHDALSVAATAFNDNLDMFDVIREPVLIHPGTERTKGQQLRIELNDNLEQIEALEKALKEQNVLYDRFYHGNPFLVIRVENNPALFTLHAEQLKKDYRAELARLNHEKDKEALDAQKEKLKKDILQLEKDDAAAKAERKDRFAEMAKTEHYISQIEARIGVLQGRVTKIHEKLAEFESEKANLVAMQSEIMAMRISSVEFSELAVIKNRLEYLNGDKGISYFTSSLKDQSDKLNVLNAELIRVRAVRKDLAEKLETPKGAAITPLLQAKRNALKQLGIQNMSPQADPALKVKHKQR